MNWPPATIAAIFKERWQIELFFKLLKQQLKIKTFVGTSANAVRIQIWTALIAVLVAALLAVPLALPLGRSPIWWLCLRWSLFTYRNLWEWLDRPFDTPPLGTGSTGTQVGQHPHFGITNRFSKMRNVT